MTVHFTPEEFAERRRRALEAMAARGLDGLLMFKQESMYWLTGYDTFGYCFFQCLVLRADGDLVLLTRAPDLRQAAAHLDHRGHPDLGGSRGQRSGRGAAGAAGREGACRQAPRHRVRDPWPDRRQRQAAGCGARRLRRGGRCLGPDRPAAPGEVRGRARLCAPRRGAGRRRARCGDRGRPATAPTKARSSPPCTRRSSGAAATTRATRSSSAPGATPCSVATSRAAASWMRRTS